MNLTGVCICLQQGRNHLLSLFLYMASTVTISISRNYFLPALVASCSASSVFSVLDSRMLSKVLPSNSLLTRRVTYASVRFWPIAAPRRSTREAKTEHCTICARLGFQTSVCPAISNASSTSIPRCRTVLSSFVWPSRS